MASASASRARNSSMSFSQLMGPNLCGKASRAMCREEAANAPPRAQRQLERHLESRQQTHAAAYALHFVILRVVELLARIVVGDLDQVFEHLAIVGHHQCR